MVPSPGKSPLVSVVISCYNHGYYLPDAINSVLYQTYPSIEIVVIDDGSTDNTAAVTKQFPSVKYVYQQNGGISSTRITGIAKTTGNYIIFLDADDWLFPDAVKINVSKLINDKQLAFVSGAYYNVNFENKFLSKKTRALEKGHYENLLQGNYIGMHASVMYSRWALNEFTFNIKLRGCEDYDMFLKIAAKYKVAHHTQVIAAYRRREDSMSTDLTFVLKTVVQVLHDNTSHIKKPELRNLIEKGYRFWIKYYTDQQWNQLIKDRKKLSFQQKCKGLLLLLQYRKPLFIRYFTSHPFVQKLNSAGKKFIPLFLMRLLNRVGLFKHTIKLQSVAGEGNGNIQGTVLLDAPSVTVLMYHRVADEVCDPWQLCVSPKNFEQQLQWLQSTGNVISIGELDQQLQDGNIKDGAIVLTFDDGYKDNFIVARPLLEKYNLPATFFITTHVFEEGFSGFYWDVVQKIFLEQKELPSHLTLQLTDKTWDFTLSNDPVSVLTNETIKWSAYTKPVNLRTETYYRVWSLLQGLTYQYQQQVIQQLLAWASVKLTDLNLPAICSVKDIQQISGHSLITTGSHTHTHAALARHSFSFQLKEIKQGKSELEKLICKKTNYFAYPDGSHNVSAKAILQKEEFALAFTTIPKTVNVTGDFLQLGRFQVNNWTTDELKHQMQSWKTKS